MISVNESRKVFTFSIAGSGFEKVKQPKSKMDLNLFE
jgi:hypothetical protein